MVLTPLSKFRAQALGPQFGVISLKQTAGAKECEQLDLSRTVLKCLSVAWRRSIPWYHWAWKLWNLGCRFYLYQSSPSAIQFQSSQPDSFGASGPERPKKFLFSVRMA